MLLCAHSLPSAGQNLPSWTDSIPVASISVTGNSAFGTGTLLERIETKEHPGALALFLNGISERLPFAAPPQYFDVAIFQQDIETITLYYKNNGFFNVRVDGRYRMEKDSNGFDVTFAIEEGPPSYVDSIGYHTTASIPPELSRDIRAQSLMRTGWRYDAELVQRESDRILESLKNNGFPLSRSDSVVVTRKRSDSNLFVDFHLFVGRRLYFGDIRDTVRLSSLNLARQIIYDRLEYGKGDVYSMARKAQSEVNLTRLGIFSGVQINAVYPPPSSPDTLVPTTIVMTPRDRHELLPGLLVRNDRLGRLNGGADIAYIFRNAFGGAQTMSTKLELVGVVPGVLQAYQATALLRFDQPYLIDNKNSASWSIAYIVARERGSYDGSILQNVIGIRRLFTQRVQGSVEWTLEQSNYSEIDNLATSPFAPYDTTGIIYRNSILGLSLERDYTDDFYNPTSGLYLKGTVEEAGALKNALPGLFSGHQSIEYVKVEGLVRHFRDLSRNRTSILGFKVKAGGIFRYGASRADNIPVPFNRRYYAGGASSNRGWGANKLHVSGEEQLARFGSNALVEISAEIRWQMFPTGKKWLAIEPERLWLVFFADAGNLWDSPLSIRLSETAIGFGFGLRYNLFFGPIRIDYGMKGYDPNLPNHNWVLTRRFWKDIFLKGIFHFGIGHAF